MHILLFGKNGQVGSALEGRLRPLGTVTALDRVALDLTDLAGIERTVNEVRPQVVINAAAYTAVDKAEGDADLATTLNSEAPGAMARAARGVGALMVHYSTDYVFDGRAQTPYTEDRPTAPNSVYGRSKLAGERAVAAAGGGYLIFRTAWVFSLHGHNFLKTMLRLAGERETLGVVDDQVGSPTYAGAIADGTVAALRAMGGSPGAHSGIYHMTCGGQTSWYGFARKIFELAGVSHVKLTPLGTDQYPTPAARPAYSVLSNEKLQRVFGVTLPHWQEALTQCLAERDAAG